MCTYLKRGGLNINVPSLFPRWETLDSFMQHDVQELCRVVSSAPKSYTP